ncbi:unnamed protein product, partial [Nesidiocoris tenuis]
MANPQIAVFSGITQQLGDTMRSFSDKGPAERAIDDVNMSRCTPGDITRTYAGSAAAFLRPIAPCLSPFNNVAPHLSPELISEG